jgi:hypothetical protein
MIAGTMRVTCGVFSKKGEIIHDKSRTFVRGHIPEGLLPSAGADVLIMIEMAFFTIGKWFNGWTMINIRARLSVPFDANPAKTSVTGRMPMTQNKIGAENRALSGDMIWNIMSKIMRAKMMMVTIPFQVSSGFGFGAAGFLVASAQGGSVVLPPVELDLVVELGTAVKLEGIAVVGTCAATRLGPTADRVSSTATSKPVKILLLENNDANKLCIALMLLERRGREGTPI